MTRPQLLHERWNAQILASLREAQTTDLTPMKRWHLANLLYDLRMTRRMQAAFGDVAPREEWDAAEARIQAEIDTRPPPAPRKRKGAGR